MYAAGAEHPHRQPSLKFLEMIVLGPSVQEHCTNTEVLQEILHRYRAIKQPETGLRLFDAVLSLGIVIHPIELLDLGIARRLLTSFPKLSKRDAVHLGMCQRREIATIVTFDTDFAQVPDIKAIKP